MTDPIIVADVRDPIQNVWLIVGTVKGFDGSPLDVVIESHASRKRAYKRRIHWIERGLHVDVHVEELGKGRRQSPIEKRCGRCLDIHDIELFDLSNQHGRLVRRSWCRNCVLEYWRIGRPEKRAMA